MSDDQKNKKGNNLWQLLKNNKVEFNELVEWL